MSYIYISQCPSYLMHSGVQGMHWGVRRYQNEDGTLTEEGKAKRRAAYAKSAKDITEAGSGIVRGIGEFTKSSSKKIDTSSMSDDELRRSVNRLMLERQYSQLKSEENIGKGRKALNKTLAVAGSALTTATSIAALTLAIINIKNASKAQFVK